MESNTKDFKDLFVKKKNNILCTYSISCIQLKGKNGREDEKFFYKYGTFLLRRLTCGSHYLLKIEFNIY